MKTSDAVTPQSEQAKPKRCEYWHEWERRTIEVIAGSMDYIICATCGYKPKPDSEAYRQAYRQAESILYLREILQPGDTVYTILNHVSRSGMERRISVCIGDVREVKNLTWHVALALGEPTKNRAGYVQDVGISQSGCGMDMGFNLVYNLGRVLFRNGFVCCGEKCQSNDHFNDPKCKRSMFVGKIHEGDGGYAFRQQWI